MKSISFKCKHDEPLEARKKKWLRSRMWQVLQDMYKHAKVSEDRLIIRVDHDRGAFGAETKDPVVRTIVMLDFDGDSGKFETRATPALANVPGFANESLAEIKDRMSTLTGPLH